MKTLRALLTAPPDPGTAVPWALYDAAGRIAARGVAPPQEWPRADVREVVLACDAVRIVALKLPPMPESRRRAAALYALEDQLAGPAESHAILLGMSRLGGVTLARVAARPLIEALANAMPPFARVIAEPDLAEPASGWRWCARRSGGFVRRSDGSCFAAGPPGPDGDLPPELAIALAQAVRLGDPPSAIDAEVGCDAASCMRWSERYGVAFRPGSEWQWEASAGFADAPDLRMSLVENRPSPLPARSVARLFKPAVLLATLALVLQVAATAGTWVARRIELAQARRTLTEVAAQAGVRDPGAGDPASTLTREHARRRHEAGLLAPGDAVAVLARISPHLALLPPGTLKSATYASRAWTLELAPVDDAIATRVVRHVAADDVPVVQARHAAGVRIRVGPLP